MKFPDVDKDYFSSTQNFLKNRNYIFSKAQFSPLWSGIYLRMNKAYQTLKTNVQIYLPNYLWLNAVSVLCAFLFTFQLNTVYSSACYPVACLHKGQILSLNYHGQAPFSGCRKQSPPIDVGELKLRLMPIFWLSVHPFHHKTKKCKIVKNWKDIPIESWECLALWFVVINLRLGYCPCTYSVTLVNLRLAFF